MRHIEKAPLGRVPSGTERRLEALLWPADVAEILGVPVKTLYVWRYTGKGPPAIKIGRHLRYHGNEVRRWLNEQN